MVGVIMKVGNQDIPQFEHLVREDGGISQFDLNRTILIECEEMISYLAYYQAGYVVVTVIPLNLNYEPHPSCMKDALTVSFTQFQLQEDPDLWRKWIVEHFEKYNRDTAPWEDVMHIEDGWVRY